ncbi:MAG TPA: Uma2 family endonuclease [Candidatus Ozemobacteraceae bacterium]|nr:Uma2 family endonuclease [Candidatus Ozemobacteraceae bacterium]HQG27251.1 Uma2 family endonuclease [Candidatus Ozemobacteraceae bacterium]
MAHPATDPKDFYTYADYLTWPDDERWEIIDGIAYNMSPSPTVNHQEAFADLVTQLRLFLRGKPCRVIPDCDVLLPKSTEAEAEIRTVVQSDLSVVFSPEKIEGKLTRGAPDMIIEIISPSSASYDHVKKKYIYERAGVRESWLVDTESRAVTVYIFDQTTGRFAEGSLIEDATKIPVATLPGLEIDFATVFPPRPRSHREPPKSDRSPPD